MPGAGRVLVTSTLNGRLTGSGLRMGDYALLAFVGGNIAREFIYGGPHTLFARGSHSAPPELAAKSQP